MWRRTDVRTYVRTAEIWKASCRPAPLWSSKNHCTGIYKGCCKPYNISGNVCIYDQRRKNTMIVWKYQDIYIYINKYSVMHDKSTKTKTIIHRFLNISSHHKQERITKFFTGANIDHDTEFKKIFGWLTKKKKLYFLHFVSPSGDNQSSRQNGTDLLASSSSSSGAVPKVLNGSYPVSQANVMCLSTWWKKEL